MANSAAQPKSRADATLDAAAPSRIAPNFPKNSSRKERAAILLAEDELTDEAIAEVVGVTKRTITNWKQEPEFAALVGDYHGQIVASVLKLPIAKKHERVKALNDLFLRQQWALDARAQRNAHELDNADNPDAATRRFFGNYVPEEARTGLFVREVSQSASGKEVVNYKYDTAITKDIKDTLKQAAQELGQLDQTLNVHHDGEVSVEIAETVRRLAAQYGTTEAEIAALAVEDDE